MEVSSYRIEASRWSGNWLKSRLDCMLDLSRYIMAGTCSLISMDDILHAVSCTHLPLARKTQCLVLRYVIDDKVIEEKPRARQVIPLFGFWNCFQLISFITFSRCFGQNTLHDSHQMWRFILGFHLNHDSLGREVGEMGTMPKVNPYPNNVGNEFRIINTVYLTVKIYLRL